MFLQNYIVYFLFTNSEFYQQSLNVPFDCFRLISFDPASSSVGCHLVGTSHAKLEAVVLNID